MDNTIIFSDTSVFRNQVSQIAGLACKLVNKSIYNSNLQQDRKVSTLIFMNFSILKI